MQIEEDVIQPRWITSSKICTALHIIRQPNSIFVLLFIQIISACILVDFIYIKLNFGLFLGTVSGKNNRCFILHFSNPEHENTNVKTLLTTRLRIICTEGDLVY